ncbi:hypothetical protein F5B20DRAFT_31307 [Whalleya microplaca]|nr:hypothetical protein F5B20DRAFT_31307 [Whalleya microplaca]
MASHTVAFAALPPELRSICRRLTSPKPEQLPSLLPSLLKDLIRCQEPLSISHEAKTPASSSESALLVHKLKTQISALLNGRTVQGRFVGTALVKAVVEAGGWECLRTSETWVRVLLSILQRKEPAVSKDLCIVTLVKIYTLMHAYPTLVREIVTPTLPTFATACLQILKPPVSSKASKAPHSLIETVFEALLTLIPLYPTTLRQFSAKIKVETRPYVVATISDGATVPSSLQASSRRLAVRLHMTAVKGGDSTEWAKHLHGLVKTFHSTADQVFRAVQENWESTSGYVSQPGNFDTEPQGGSSSPEQFPPWTGVHAGSERMINLLNYIADYLRCRTKTAVVIPISAIVDVTTRVSSIMPPVAGREKVESVQMNPAVGRDEKDELWTVFPDIQLAAMKLLLATAQRLWRNFLPVAQETLEQVLRMFESSYRLPEVRTMTFILIRELLQLLGPTIAKVTVEGLSLVIKACCRDLLGSASHLKRPKQAAAALQNGSKSKTVSQNADAFLAQKADDDFVSVSLSADHVSAAEALLATLFSHVPQQHLPSSLRSHMLKTAIFCRSRDAQVASVLHPSRDRSGRTPQVILPYLTRQFPHDESVEILRFNFRPLATGARPDIMDIEDMVVDDDERETKAPNNGFSFDRPFVPSFSSAQSTLPAAEPLKASSVAPVQVAESVETPFLPQPSEATIRSEEEQAAVQPPRANSLKRKNEDDAETAVSKRVEIDGTRTSSAPSPGSAAFNAPPARGTTGQEEDKDEDEESDNESVHLNMELDSDDDDEDEGEDED